MKSNSRKKGTTDLSREERTRTEILDASLKLFQRFGIRKTTLEDIAGSLGKKKSFLYYYYAGKDEIITACFQREMDEILAYTREQIALQATPQAKLHTFFSAPLVKASGRIHAFEQVIEEVRTDGQEMSLMTSLRITFHQRETLLLQQILKEGMAAKAFRPVKPAVLDSLCSFTTSAMIGVEMGLVWGTVSEASLKHLEEVTSILIRGLET